MEKIEEELKERVKRLRAEAGLSQVALANRAGISVQTVKDIEAGRKGAGIKVLQSLSVAFKISIEDLAGEKPPVVQRVEKFKLGKMLKYLENVPDEVFELSVKLGRNNPAWDDVIAVLEEAIEELKEASQKSKKA